MPHFFFDVRDDGRLEVDQQGLDFASLELAQASAVRALAEMLKDVLPDGRTRDFVMIVRSETREPLVTAELSFQMRPGG